MNQLTLREYRELVPYMIEAHRDKNIRDVKRLPIDETSKGYIIENINRTYGYTKPV